MAAVRTGAAPFREPNEHRPQIGPQTKPLVNRQVLKPAESIHLNYAVELILSAEIATLESGLCTAEVVIDAMLT